MLAFFVSADTLAGATIWHQVELVNGRILIDIEIAGVPAKALIDSGASQIVVSKPFLEDNGIPYIKGRSATVVGAQGKYRTHKIKTIDVGIFGYQFPFKDVVASTSDRSYQMLIGLPFLKRAVVQIDYPNSRMRFLSHDSVDLKKHANVDMKHGSKESKLVASVELGDGEKVNLMFDTGATPGIVVNRYFAERQGWLEKYRVGKVKLSGMAETIIAEKLQIPYLKFGPYELENIKVIVPKESNGLTNYSKGKTESGRSRLPGKEAGYDGIMGGDVFKHFVVTLDAKNALLHISAPPPDLAGQEQSSDRNQ